MDLQTDVVIVGAGVSGLAAARRLHQHGTECLILEAQSRIGGRVYVQRAPDDTPIELGGEFIHGTAAVTRELLREAGDHAVDQAEQMFEMRGQSLHAMTGVWEAAQRLLSRVDPHGADSSVKEFLEALSREGADPHDIERTAQIIEGFDAAILNDASVIAVAREWNGEASASQARPSAGYGPLLRTLSAPIADRILLQARVLCIKREQSAVTVSAQRLGEALSVVANSVILTVPIGVLRSHAIAFDPPLPEQVQRAIGCIADGPVYKVVLHFASPFWETLDDGRFADAAFFQMPDGPMRTVWTQFPKRLSTLTAWAGGDAAMRLREQQRDPVAAAVHGVQRLFPQAAVLEQLRGVYFHDWQSDPNALGAYSYVRVGGVDARKTLADSVDRQLIIAGEAASEDQSGTVAGAIASGYAAADRVSLA